MSDEYDIERRQYEFRERVRNIALHIVNEFSLGHRYPPYTPIALQNCEGNFEGTFWTVEDIVRQVLTLDRSHP